MTHPRSFSFALFSVVALAARATATEPSCAGSPFVNAIRPRAIESSAGVAVGPQIFDVAAHPRGFVMMANNYGLLASTARPSDSRVSGARAPSFQSR